MSEARIHTRRVEEAVATLSIDRPDKSNALDLGMVPEMNHAWDELERDKSLRVVIIRSALPRVFVAGGDIEAMRNLALVDGDAFVYAGHDLMRRLERSRLVVIAAVGGYALGGGTELALACDL